jgi:FkbM family methyltransferase
MPQPPEEIVTIDWSGIELRYYAPDCADHIQKVLRSEKRLYEENALIDIFSRGLKRGMVIDVGANIGNHTVFFGKVLNRRVMALEPYEKAFRVLERNVELNGLSKRVMVLRKAAGRSAGRGRLEIPPEGNWGKARLLPEHDGAIEIIRLDDLKLRGPVALVKIDVEGMEADVLEGARRLLKRKQPVIYVEAQTALQYGSVRRILRSLGYEMVRRFNHTPTFVFVPCCTKKQRTAALFEMTDALASLETIAINQHDTTRALAQLESVLKKSLEASMEVATKRQSEAVATQLRNFAEGHAKQILEDIQAARREMSGEFSRRIQEGQLLLRRADKFVDSSAAQLFDSLASTQEVLKEAINELKLLSGSVRPEATSSSPTENTPRGVRLRLPIETVALDILINGHGVTSEPQTSRPRSDRVQTASSSSDESGVHVAPQLNANAVLANEANKITVIMTTFNSIEFVAKAVRNVLEQTHRDLELITVDDASTDDTFEVLLELARDDPRVVPIKMFKNRGTYWCKNYAITRSTGHYITFQDSDDASAPDRLERQLRELQQTGCVLCTCNYVRVDASGNVLLNRGREERKAIMAPLIDKQEILRHVGYFDSVRTSADDEFTRRIGIAFGQHRICHIDLPLYRATVRDGSLTSDARTKADISVGDSDVDDLSFLSAPRREYVRQYRTWHEELKKGNDSPRIDFPQLRRRFPAPAHLLPEVHHEDCYVTASMASFPARLDLLEQAVDSILSQVDFLNVYLNGYDETPRFLRSSKIQVIHSREYGDLRDNGKFFFLDSVPWGYHFTIDDDIIYPHDYVQKMVLKIEQYDRKAIVGCHGIILGEPLIRFMTGRKVFHFKCALEQDKLVNVLGTGTIAYHTGTITLSMADFGQPGMADVWLAIAAKSQCVPMIAIQRRHQWLQPLGEADETSLFSLAMKDDVVQTKVVKEHGPWNLDVVRPSFSAMRSVLHGFTPEELATQDIDAKWVHTMAAPHEQSSCSADI